MRHIMKKLTIIFLLINGILFSQEKPKTYTAKYPPESINQAIEYMEYKWTETEKENFKNQNEEDAVSSLHFSYGMMIRNSWLRRGNHKLNDFFHKKKVFHLDDMSWIILKAFHRKLNNKKLDLDKIFKAYKKKWHDGKKGRKIYADSIKKVFENFKINDTITCAYYTTAIGITPEEIEKYRDCKPIAVILKKRKRDLSLFIKLISSCNGIGIETGVYGEKFSTLLIKNNQTGWTKYWEWEHK